MKLEQVLNDNSPQKEEQDLNLKRPQGKRINLHKKVDENWNPNQLPDPKIKLKKGKDWLWSLPLELQIKVSAYLGPAELALRMNCLNKYWRSLATSSTLWEMF